MQAASVVPHGPSVDALQRPNPHYVDVSHGVFGFLWLCAALLHVLCGMFYFGIAYGYWTTTPDTPLARMLHFYKFGIDMAQYRTVAITHGAIGVVHATLLVNMVVCSLVERRWSFSAATNRKKLKQGPGTKLIPRQDGRRHGSFVQLTRTIRNALATVLGRRGLLGVEGPYFDAQLLCLEVIETALQSYQAYRMSKHVPRPWLNNFFVALIVLNCTSSPILHRIFRYNSLARRVSCLAIDSLLDLVSSVVVPGALLISYSVDYVESTGGFKSSLWFSDTWFVSASNEFQLMLVASSADLATRMLISLSFIGSMESLKPIVRMRARKRTTPSMSSISATSARPVGNPATSTSTQSRTASMLSSVDNWLRNSKQGRRIKFVAHAALATWGVAILSIHLHAASLPDAPVCAMQVRPWLQAKPACALMLIDCHKEEFNDLVATERLARFSVSDPHRVVRLVIRHCPALQIPSTLQSLQAMTAIKIYNSTIANWPSDAALTSAHHPALKTVSIVRAVFPDGQLPAGLTDTNFPKHVSSLLFCKTNLSSLPVEIAKAWPQYAYFLFEFSQFSTFQPALAALNPIQISFAENQFSEFPFEALQIRSLVFLNMGGNRGISSLLPPNGTIGASSVVFVNLVNTNVSVLPDWYDARLRMTVNSTTPQYYPIFAASGTPLCENTAKIISGELTSYPGVESIPPARRSFLMNFTHTDAASLLSMSLCWPITTLYYPLGWEDEQSHA